MKIQSTIKERVSQLSPVQQEKLFKRLELIQGIKKSEGIKKQTDLLNPPLSFSQEQLWIQHRLDPENPAYNFSVAFKIKEKLEFPVFRRSLEEIIQRHSVLRAEFVNAINGKASQQIKSIYEFPIPIVILKERPKHKEAIENLLHDEVRLPFDLSCGPMLRVKLWRYKDEDCFLSMIIHHIIGDGWSIGVFVRELKSLYEAFSQGLPSPLAPLPIQYGDFACWQRERKHQQEIVEDLAFWRNQLTGTPPLLLGGEREKKKFREANYYQGAVRDFKLDKEVSSKLRKLSRQEGVTLFMTLLTIFQILLCRYSEQTDFAVGTPVAKRERSELENLIGYFVNTIVLRADLQGNPTFSEMLSRTRNTTLEGFTHDGAPFEKIVEFLNPERTNGFNPIYQVMFSLQNMTLKEVKLHDVTLSPIIIHNGSAKFDLSLLMEDEKEEISAILEVNTTVFDAEATDRFVKHFIHLASEIAFNEEQHIQDISILTEEEKKIQCLSPHLTSPAYTDNNSSNRSVHDLIDAQSLQHPNRIAIQCDQGEGVSYDELSKRSNQLARYLMTLGVEKEHLVVVHMNRRTPDVVVAILAILKAGAAFVPLDADLPTERFKTIVESIENPIILTQESYLDRLKFLNASIISIDSDDKQFKALSTSSPEIDVSLNNLAYVVYTSGSTGKPKGVMVEHHSLINYLQWAKQSYEAWRGNGAPLFAPLSYDLQFTSLFLPLVSGKTVTLFDEDNLVDSFHKMLISRCGYSFVKITPTHLGIMERKWRGGTNGNTFKKPGTFSNYLIIGGEQLYGEQIKFLKKFAPSTAVVNEYGPTEATIGCCAYFVPDQAVPSGPISIGKPIANTHIHILDKWSQPVPIGSIGELFIGGLCLARGYKDPSVNEACFPMNELLDGPGGRLYRTGDLASYGSDGNIEFLGREDTQVKLRGYRVELGEIETLLRQHQSIKDCVVLNKEIVSKNKCSTTNELVAYVAAKKDFASREQLRISLRNYLNKKLFSYMIPAYWVFLESLPFDSNGKIDRAQLPNPLKTDIQIRETPSFVKPQDILEWHIISICEEVLNIQPISMTDDFFELGGHSLAALTVVDRLKEMIGHEIPIVSFYRERTIESLVKFARKNLESTDRSPLVTIQPLGPKPPLYCIHPAGGNVICYAELSSHLGNNQPLYGLQSPEPEDGQLQPTSVEELARLYVNTILDSSYDGPLHLIGWSFGGMVAFEMACQLQTAKREVNLLGMLDTSYVTTILNETDLIHRVAMMRNIEIQREDLVELSKNKKVELFLERGKKSGAFLYEQKPENIYLFLELFKQHQNLAKDYRPKYYEGQITYFKAQETAEDKARESIENWTNVSHRPLRVVTIPGDHQSILTNPHVSILSSKLADLIS